MRAATASMLGVMLVAWAMAACDGPVPSPPPGAVSPTARSTAFVALPSPATTGGMPVDRALASRRSVRDFTDEPLSPRELGQLLWAAQGITSAWGGRTAPSAGALYPLELYIATDRGLYHYSAERHGLEELQESDLRGALGAAGLGQSAVSDAPAVIVVTAVQARAEAKYGSRAGRYVQLEAGHAAQNVLLEAVSLGLGAVPIGAFSDDAVRAILGASPDRTPLYLIPVGHPARAS